MNYVYIRTTLCMYVYTRRTIQCWFEFICTSTLRTCTDSMSQQHVTSHLNMAMAEDCVWEQTTDAHCYSYTHHLALDEAVKVLCGSILLCKVKVHQCPALLLHVDDTEEDLGVGFEQRDEVEHAIPVSSAAERGTREQQELSKVDVAVMSK